MTTPTERTRAVLQTERFLQKLASCEHQVIREEAKHLLRHYPNAYDMGIVSMFTNEFVQNPFGEVKCK